MEFWITVMEFWSDGVMRERGDTTFGFHYSITPSLHHSSSNLLP
ncbi:MAG TPA: hypothetical protein VGM65_13330 [Candidatus Udaeobacter sp.]